MMRESPHSLGHRGAAAHGQPAGKRAWFALRLILFALGLVAAVFIVGFGIFADHVGRLSAPDNIESADGIVVLTGGYSRIDAAVELLKAGKGKRLLISGVNPIAGADDLRVATGGDPVLFNCCVDIDHAALDTIGNAEESAKWIGTHTYRSIILVTNNYHMPRSLLEMKRILPEARLQPYPVVNTPLENGAWLAKPDALRVLTTEYAKYVAALIRSVFPLRRHAVQPDMVHAVAAGTEQ